MRRTEATILKLNWLNGLHLKLSAIRRCDCRVWNWQDANLHAFCHEPTDTILAFSRPTGELVTPADTLDGGSLTRPRYLREPTY